MGMFPVLFMMGRSSGSGYSDPRPRCKCCGRILPKERTFRKWLANSKWGIPLTTLLGCLLFLYVLLTSISWASERSFTYDGTPETLFRYVADQWAWIWKMLHQLW